MKMKIVVFRILAFCVVGWVSAVATAIVWGTTWAAWTCVAVSLTALATAVACFVRLVKEEDAT